MPTGMADTASLRSATVTLIPGRKVIAGDREHPARNFERVGDGQVHRRDGSDGVGDRRGERHAAAGMSPERLPSSQKRRRHHARTRTPWRSDVARAKTLGWRPSGRLDPRSGQQTPHLPRLATRTNPRSSSRMRSSVAS